MDDPTPAPGAPTRPTVALAIEAATPETIAPYGTLVEPGVDGTPFGPQDAQLALDRGVPRFYVMTLHARPLRVDHITQHRAVTQCLAALDGQDWIMVMAPPGERPDPAQLRAFRLSGQQALAMHVGTWHAGPLLTQPSCHFVNLELSDTNIVDHHTVALDAVYQLTD
jgi:ureidoglycolate lyase